MDNPQTLNIGKFKIELYKDGHFPLFITVNGGEGGSFDVKKFEKAIEDFYRKEF